MSTNLQFIKSVTPTGASSSISITDVFSADYDVYVVNYSWVTDSTSPKDLDFRFINSSDTIVSNSNYDYAYLLMYVASTYTENRAENQDKISAMLSAVDYPPEGNAGTFTVYNPFATSYTYLTSQSANSWNGTRAGWRGIAILKEETSITGFNMFISSTNPTSESNISVYGVK